MTFYSLDNAPIGQYDTVFRQSRLVKAIAVLFVLAFMAIPAWLWKSGRLPTLGFCLSFGFLCLFLLVFLNVLRKSFGPQNWLMRVKPDGLLIKFRSYLNTNFSTADRVIVFLKLDEIEAVSSTSERLKVPDLQHSSQIENRHYLDIICKAGVDIAELKQCVDEERHRKPPQARIQTESLDFPVQIVDGRTIRIRWLSASGSTTPSLRRTLKILSSIVSLRPPQKLVNDFYKPAATNAANDARIRELALRGDMIAATQLARDAYHCSQTEASKRVDELLASPPRAE
jgi:hypothetical protein